MLSLYFGPIVFGLLAVAGTIVLAYLLVKNPERLGLPKPAPKISYLITLAPGLFVLFFWYTHRDGGGISFPTGLAVYENAVILKGQVETVRESTVDETRYSEFYNKGFIFDKETGKKIAELPMFPLYARKGLLLAEDGLGYHSFDLKDGSLRNSYTESEIKGKVQTIANEKVYEMKIEENASAFNVRTVKDKQFTFDPLHNEVNVDDPTPFFRQQRASRSQYNSTKTDLFKPEIVATTKDGVTIVVSYEDLEQKAYSLTAISPDGNIVWTKRDGQISDKLAGHLFSHEYMELNAAVDESSLYFVNSAYLVCMDLKDGRTKWVNEI